MEEKVIFLGIINNLDEYISINKSFPFEEITVSEEIEQYNEKIITITEEEIKEYFGTYKDIKELREIAIKYFIRNIQGQMFDIGEYKNIRINRRSAEKYKRFSADERKLFIIPKLLNILTTSQYKFSLPNYKERKDKMTQFHYFTNKVILKGIEYNVFITIGEDDKGNLFWDLEENEKPSETLHHTSDVFSKGSNSII